MQEKRFNVWVWLAQKTAAGALAAAMTVSIFLVLPILQSIGDRSQTDLDVRSLDVANLPPPPPPPPEPEPEPEEEEEQPPELIEEAPPLDLAQIELALNPGFGDGGAGNFAVSLVNQLASGSGNEEINQIFSLAELDRQPRVIFQRPPNYPPELRRARRQGTVYVVFLVDKQGQVVNPKVQQSTDPAFDRPALEAVRQWKFEPGTRKGEKVQFKMRIPITFNAG